MRGLSLTKTLVQTKWLKPGVIQSSEGEILKCFEFDPLSSGAFEEKLEGSNADGFFQKSAELLTRLPNLFKCQIILFRFETDSDIKGLRTRLLVLENVRKEESYSHFEALLKELDFNPSALSEQTWKSYLATLLGKKLLSDALPDITWEKDCITADEDVVRALSLTELPQITWNGCLTPLFESSSEFAFSMRMEIPDRKKTKRQLETKRRVSHALSISTSLEVKNIESNSVLHSSEETLERILINKETLFEVSIGLTLKGSRDQTESLANDFERTISGIGNAGLYKEGIGSLPVIVSHLPGSKALGVRKLPVLSENLAHLLPVIHDFSRTNDGTSLQLRSRTEEVSHMNFFSSENLNFNSFICGASGSGKSFLMNAIISSMLKDEARTRICIFDIGRSYSRIVAASGGTSLNLTVDTAGGLIASFLTLRPVDSSGFFRLFVEALCGSGSHITHSHRVAIDDLLRQIEGSRLSIKQLIEIGSAKPEKFYQDIAHWLKPHTNLDDVPIQTDFLNLISAQVTCFDFKDLESDPVLQRTAILMLTEMLWTDLVKGEYPKTLIVFDEVWRFFEKSKSFLEEMYRTLRKYRAGICSITQNLADYGDEAFAKMIFTNSFTKIFLQNGAAAEFLKSSFDLPDSDIQRALSVTSKKPLYSEFFALSPSMSQVFRLHSTPEFYALANTENASARKESI